MPSRRLKPKIIVSMTATAQTTEKRPQVKKVSKMTARLRESINEPDKLPIDESVYTVHSPFAPEKEISVKEALISPYAKEHLIPAIDREMHKLTTTYEALKEIKFKDIDKDAVRIRSKMFVIWKMEGTGKVTKANARLAAGGNLQPDDSYVVCL